MVIDCHGHYTSSRPYCSEYRKQQIAALNDPVRKRQGRCASPTIRSARSSNPLNSSFSASAAPTWRSFRRALPPWAITSATKLPKLGLDAASCNDG